MTSLVPSPGTLVAVPGRGARAVLATANALVEGIESRYRDGVLGSTGRMVTKARSASRDLLDKGPPSLRAQDDDPTDQG